MAPRSVVHEEKSPYETWREYDNRRGVPHQAQRPSESFSDYDKRRKAEMATAASTKARPVRVVKGANFEPKRVRKAKRKALVRGYLANRVADAKAEAADRAEFFRNLRMMKITRRKVAWEMGLLREQLRVLEQTVSAVERLHPNVDLRLVDETHDLVHSAYKTVAVAADEFWTFSRQRIYYVKELAA